MSKCSQEYPNHWADIIILGACIKCQHVISPVEEEGEEQAKEKSEELEESALTGN